MHQKLTLLTTQQVPQEIQNHVSFLTSSLFLISDLFNLQMPQDGIQLDLQKALFSGVNSPATISSPSCEVRNELVFPSLPTTQSTSVQPQSLQEPAKVTPKINHLSELEQQLSKLHIQRTVLPQQSQQPLTQTYSEAVRQSPTTVQALVTPVQNIQATNQVVTPIPSQVQAPVVNTTPRKLSRFVISKVSDESKAASQQQPNQSQQLQQQASQVTSKSTVTSPENEQMRLSPTSSVQPTVPSQQNQAQSFFLQHHGSVVSRFDFFVFVTLTKRQPRSCFSAPSIVVACSCFYVELSSFVFGSRKVLQQIDSLHNLS